MTDAMRGGAPLSPALPGDASYAHLLHPAMACHFGLVAAEGRQLDQIAHEVFRRIDEIENELSRYRADSDVSRINAAEAGQWVRVGPECLACMETAERLHRDTNGAFDATVGALTGGAERGRAVVGMEGIEISRDFQAIGVRVDGMRVDLGGIGKGFALDEAGQVLARWEVSDWMLHSGQSTVLTRGAEGPSRPWRAGLRDPLDPRKALGDVRLTGGALSGSAARLHGEHIIDPRNGRPARLHVAAWALAPSAAMADALSTAFMVMSEAEIDAYCGTHEGIGAAVAASTAEGVDLRLFGSFEAALRSR